MIMNRSQLLFVLAAIFLIASIVWFVRLNTIVGIGALVVAIVMLVLALITRKRDKKE